MIVTVKKYGWKWQATATDGFHYCRAYSISQRRAADQAARRFASKWPPTETTTSDRRVDA